MTALDHDTLDTDALAEKMAQAPANSSAGTAIAKFWAERPGLLRDAIFRANLKSAARSYGSASGAPQRAQRII